MRYWRPRYCEYWEDEQKTEYKQYPQYTRKYSLQLPIRESFLQTNGDEIIEPVHKSSTSAFPWPSSVRDEQTT